MKICIDCQEEKPLDHFVWKNKLKDQRNARCKVCLPKYRRKQYLATKDAHLTRTKKYKDKLNQFVRSTKEKPCTDCKIQYPWYVMQFDHLADKAFTISRLNASWENIVKEIDKCEIVCANCHAIRTYKRRNNLPL